MALGARVPCAPTCCPPPAPPPHTSPPYRPDTPSPPPTLYRCTAVPQRVVIMGTGSFALEAMEAAGRNNAAKIYLISRPRKR